MQASRYSARKKDEANTLLMKKIIRNIEKIAQFRPSDEQIRLLLFYLVELSLLTSCALC